jgi:bifunctional DNA-binding transcriptional regulator/antitoxin component of YhaV-PrlF toxin-antitoxin module
MYRFRGVVEKGHSAVNSWSFVTVPSEIVAELSGARRICGTIEQLAFDGTLQARGDGVRALVITRAIRDALGIEPGREIEIAIDADTRPRPVDVPPELAAALERRPAARRAFAELAPSHQREYARWIADAKKDATKSSRIQRALEMIVAKQRLR